MSSWSDQRRPPRSALVVGLVIGSVVVSTIALKSGAAGAVDPMPSVGHEIPVTAMNLSAEQSKNSPALASDPTDSRFLALASRVDGPTFDCALHVSGDSGASWRPARPISKLPAPAERCYAPEVAFDGRGRLYYLFVGLAGRGNSPVGVFLTSSTDGARSFTAPRRVLGPERYQVRMALDAEMGRRGRLHLVWLEARSDPPLGGLPPPPNPIMAAFSDDGGRSFSKPLQVSDPARLRVVAPAVALGPDHHIHVIYYDLLDDVRDYHGLEGPAWEGHWSLVSTSSADGGRTFRKGVVIDDRIVPPERVMLIFTMAPPSLVADRSNRLYAAWHDKRRGDWDVFVRSSSDGGRRWSALRRIQAEPPGRHQYLPRLGVTGGGRVDLVFYDRRDDPRNLVNHVYATFSSDDGASFAPSVRVTTEGSYTDVGARYSVPSAKGMIEFGSRLALLPGGSTSLAAWTDTRFSRRGTVEQNIVAASLKFPSDESPSGLGRWGVVPVLAGAGGVATALGVLVRRRRRQRAGGEVRNTLERAER